MLIDFTVGNFRSFNQPMTLSLVADDKDELPDNCFQAGNLTLLKSVVIYGPNASGKSNLIFAFNAFIQLVEQSADSSRIDGPIPEYQPFLLSSSTEEKPTEFEVRFFIDGFIYRYGMEFDHSEIKAEWLYRKKTKETALFEREGQTIQCMGDFKKEGKNLEERTRKNTLFLSVCAQFNGAISKLLFDEITGLMIIDNLIDDIILRSFTSEIIIDNVNARQAVLRLMQSAGIAMNGIKIILQKNPNESIHFLHSRFDAKGKKIEDQAINLDEESEGTQRLFTLSAFFYELLEGKNLIIDELDSSLHPLLQEYLIKLVHDPSNQHGQLIFTTHSTEILSNRLFRRDQIWFAEQDQQGATELFSLLEIKGIRKDLSYGKNYLLGRFGGVPKLKPLQVDHA